MDTWLSWKHRRSELSRSIPLSQKIDIFYERLCGWQLHIADQFVNGSSEQKMIPHAAFAALQVCLSYFETIGKYEAGYCHDDQSRHHFGLGLKSVFPHLRRVPSQRFNRVSKLLYQAARCGLYHASQTGPGVLLRRQQHVLRFNAHRGWIHVDPHRLPIALKKHLSVYRARLERSRNKKVQRQFENRFNHDNPGLA